MDVPTPVKPAQLTSLVDWLLTGLSERRCSSRFSSRLFHKWLRRNRGCDPRCTGDVEDVQQVAIDRNVYVGFGVVEGALYRPAVRGGFGRDGGGINSHSDAFGKSQRVGEIFVVGFRFMVQIGDCVLDQGDKVNR